MIIQLATDITATDQDVLIKKLNDLNIKPNIISTQFKNYIVGIPKVDFDLRNIGNMNGIEDIHRVSDDY